jgi:hypothetical protein
MNDQRLEEEIRRLRPAPLPTDLKARLAREPELHGRKPRRHMWLAAAAALVVLAAGIAAPSFFRDTDTSPAVATSPVSVIQRESTLLGTRTVDQRELDGQVWELIEEQWQDDTIAACSATPVRVCSSVIRPAYVWVAAEYQ